MFSFPESLPIFYFFYRQSYPLGSEESVLLSHFINKDNADRSVVMRGFSYNTRVKGVKYFLEGHGNVPFKNIHLERINGVCTGICGVIFSEPYLAYEAKKMFDRKYITQRRYVDVFTRGDRFFQQKCELRDEESAMFKEKAKN